MFFPRLPAVFLAYDDRDLPEDLAREGLFTGIKKGMCRKAHPFVRPAEN